VTYFEGAVFDMDGVVTKTADVHMAAWKLAFEEFLRAEAVTHGAPFQQFSKSDYLAYVDGRPRYEGVAAFLRSRGLNLPLGVQGDTTDRKTVCGLGNRKDQLLLADIEARGVPVFESTIQLIQSLRQQGVRVGLATSSKNSEVILRKAGIGELFDVRIDGVISENLGLRGKPEPDLFRAACEMLEVKPSRAMIVEDSAAGVIAGAAGQFGLTLGVARAGNSEELRRSGADLVVRDLSEISFEEVNDWFKGCVDREM
jgi:HAD superfamily hydrolase (TIGR01509 family)